MATLKDVAAKAGVTVTTVSRMLNNRGYISQQTREKVLAAMKELDYHPNELARSLTKRHTNIIGIIVPSVAHPFFSQAVNELEMAASASGYKTLLCNSFHQAYKEMEYLDMLRAHKVAGVVLCSRTQDIGGHLESGLPIVTFERSDAGNVSSVSCDNFQGGVLATEHLIVRGCRCLLHFSGSHGVQMPADQRCAAFQDTCRRYHLEGRVFETEEAQFQTMDYGDYIRQVLERNPDADGIFASSDVIAAQVLQACAALGRRVPEDVQVIGFDDVPLARLTTPQLTTIRQPIRQMSVYAFNAIQRQADQEGAPSRTVFPVTLECRASTR